MIVPSTDNGLEPEVQGLMRDAKMSGVEAFTSQLYPMLDFVLHGRARDGESSFIIAPALGDLDPKEQKAAFDLIDQKIEEAVKARAESEAIRLYEAKADALVRLDRDEDAIAALQKVLDLFPTSTGAASSERKIKRLLGAESDAERKAQEKWAQALSTCDDMDIRVGFESAKRKLHRMGLAGLDAQAAELEKACKVTPKTRSAFAYVYDHLAIEAAYHEDCDRFRAWLKKYFDCDGSPHDMMTAAPWCERGDVTKDVAWFVSTLNEGWTLEGRTALTSTLSDNVLTLSATTSLNQTLQFRLEPDGAGWKCTHATWQRGLVKLDSACTATVTKLASGRGDFDEGTFSADFVDIDGSAHRKMQLTDGKFRLRRN
jgi:hypothetical protein